MRVIHLTDGPLSAQRRLAALMLCAEHGALAFGPGLEPLPPPHAAWPAVPLPPVTEGGARAEVHYRPAVGIVFYTAGRGFDPRALAAALHAHLAPHAAHLAGPRALAATPTSLLRAPGRAGVGTEVVVAKRIDRVNGRPARIIAWHAETAAWPAGLGQARRSDALPSHFSDRAAFVWHLIPATVLLSYCEQAAITCEDGVTIGADMCLINALVASILYDAAGVCVAPEGADTFQLMSLADFTIPAAPFRGLPQVRAADARWAPGGPAAVPGRPAAAGGALVVAAGKAPVFVGDYRVLRSGLPRGLDRLPLVAWEPGAVHAPEPGQFRCCACAAPAGGTVVLLRGTRVPRVRPHGFTTVAHGCYLPEGTPLAPEPKALLLCPYCWQNVLAPACLTACLGATVVRAETGLSQAQMCAACPGYEELGPILAGVAQPVPGAAGAFVVRLPNAEQVVLAGQALGPYPALAVPALVEMGLPVVPGLLLAEVAP